MNLGRSGHQEQLTDSLWLGGGKGEADRTAERMRHKDERLGDPQPFESLSEICEEFFERVRRAWPLGLTVAAQVGRDDAIALAEMVDLMLPLYGLPTRAMDANDRSARRQHLRPGVDRTQAHWQCAGDADGCTWELHEPSVACRPSCIAVDFSLQTHAGAQRSSGGLSRAVSCRYSSRICSNACGRSSIGLWPARRTTA